MISLKVDVDKLQRYIINPKTTTKLQNKIIANKPIKEKK